MSTNLDHGISGWAGIRMNEYRSCLVPNLPRLKLITLLFLGTRLSPGNTKYASTTLRQHVLLLTADYGEYLKCRTFSLCPRKFVVLYCTVLIKMLLS